MTQALSALPADQQTLPRQQEHTTGRADMNLNITTAATAAPVVEDLVIEDFGGAVVEQYQPGTCICWTGDLLAE
ncbi:hypothetical protein ABZZ37_27060 [Streptomyces sp. NPDC006464]|uniref:hypothetical protein n=1 Tax=unclassified Streptomyces TaxID=2593676 RepID=UPI0033A5A6E5